MRYECVYVEKKALDLPLTKSILDKLGDIKVINVDHYKDIFDRKRQDIRYQKENPALILAVREGRRIYKGASVCQSFGNVNFYYASSAMNCPFDCEYCYLKGMYQSGYIVVFVNTEDYRKDISECLRQGPLYVCASYDSDLCALEGLTGLASFWAELARENKDLLVELRTKAAPSGFKKIPNLIYAFTISPQEIIDRYERYTASLDARLKAAARALDSGCRVRLCFDPLIKTEDFEGLYGRMIDKVADSLDMSLITDVSVGTFRISGEYLNRMRKAYPDSGIAWYPYVIEDKVAQYDTRDDRAMQDYVISRLEGLIGREKIFKWNE